MNALASIDVQNTCTPPSIHITLRVAQVNVYCNTLEPFIVNGRIPRGQMDSEVGGAAKAQPGSPGPHGSESRIPSSSSSSE